MEEIGREAITERFQPWFGAADDFEVLGTTLSEVGGRLHLSWHLHLRPAPTGAGWHTIEQHAFVTPGTDRTIEALDLLCSGFLANPERVDA